MFFSTRRSQIEARSDHPHAMLDGQYGHSNHYKSYDLQLLVLLESSIRIRNDNQYYLLELQGTMIILSITTMLQESKFKTFVIIVPIYHIAQIFPTPVQPQSLHQTAFVRSSTSQRSKVQVVVSSSPMSSFSNF